MIHFVIYFICKILFRTGASKSLSKEKPNGNLFSYEILISISLQTFFVFIFQFCSWVILKNQTWFERIPFSNNPLFENPNYENTVK